MHDVTGIISRIEDLRDAVKELPEAVVCPLPQGFALLPLTREFIAGLKGRTGENDLDSKAGRRIPGIPQSVQAFAQKLARSTPVAHVSTEYFGGQGGQSAFTWSRGIFGSQAKPRAFTDRQWPNSAISQALRHIGVSAESGRDEFDTLGLGAYRETSKWARAFKAEEGGIGLPGEISGKYSGWARSNEDQWEDLIGLVSVVCDLDAGGRIGVTIISLEFGTWQGTLDQKENSIRASTGQGESYFECRVRREASSGTPRMVLEGAVFASPLKKLLEIQLFKDLRGERDLSHRRGGQSE